MVAGDIVQESISHYFDEAEKIFLSDPKRADRYVDIARKLAMRHRARIPKKYQLKFCKHCYTYLRPGVNARVRKNVKTISIYCERCKRFTRFGSTRK
ncbi:MAG: ribonuclease P [Candidatus Woesearchaeota archaeon]